MNTTPDTLVTDAGPADESATLAGLTNVFSYFVSPDSLHEWIPSRLKDFFTPNSINPTVDLSALDVVQPVTSGCSWIHGQEFVQTATMMAKNKGMILADPFLMAALLKNQSLIPPRLLDLGLKGLFLSFPGIVLFREEMVKRSRSTAPALPKKDTDAAWWERSSQNTEQKRSAEMSGKTPEEFETVPIREDLVHHMAFIPYGRKPHWYWGHHFLRAAYDETYLAVCRPA